MKRIRRRLRKVRIKLARVLRALEVAHRETHRQWKKARHAADVRDKAERQGRTVDARKAERRRLYHANKGRRWERRTDWLAGKRRYLTQAQKDLLKKKEKWLDDHPPPKPSGGWATFDGKSVPNWMVPWLEKSRRAGWGGVVVSGIRTPDYSEQLCYNMCGAPSCSGMCAGRNSNHNCTSGCPYPTGALDVSDYYNFQSIQYRIGSPLRNHLPSDRVHFSVSGY